VEVRSRLAGWWFLFADAIGTFLEEAAFRVSLAWAVLRGKSPKSVEKRPWSKAAEAPTLIDVYSWTDERHVFSVLVWPALEVAPNKAAHAQQERAKQVIRVLHAGAAEMAWSTRCEVDYGLRWDSKRQVWTAADGFAYEPPEKRSAVR
jgi:hypothetical protein